MVLECGSSRSNRNLTCVGGYSLLHLQLMMAKLVLVYIIALLLFVLTTSCSGEAV